MPDAAYVVTRSTDGASLALPVTLLGLPTGVKLESSLRPVQFSANYVRGRNFQDVFNTADPYGTAQAHKISLVWRAISVDALTADLATLASFVEPASWVTFAAGSLMVRGGFVDAQPAKTKAHARVDLYFHPATVRAVISGTASNGGLFY